MTRNEYVALLLGFGLAAVLAVWAWSGPGRDASTSSSASTPTSIDARAGDPVRSGGGVEARIVDPAATPSRLVAAQLIDPESGPLSDGRIDLWCDDHRLASRLTIGEDGHFVAPACAGVTCARLVHPMFEQPRVWELEADVVHELDVIRARGVSGQVRSIDGEPVPDASLLLQTKLGRASGRTDSAGAFAISLPDVRPCDGCDSSKSLAQCRAPEVEPADRQASLLVWAPGFAPRELELSLEHIEGLDIPLEPPAAPIQGTVRGTDGTLPGTRTMVLATNHDCDADQHAAAVASDGSFQLVDLAEAEYRLRVVRDGQELAVRERVATGDSVDLRAAISSRPIDLEIIVVDDHGRPQSGVRVDGGPLRGELTDALGRVSADEVLPGSYGLRVHAPGCSVIRAQVEIGADEPSPRREVVRLPPVC